MVRPLWPILASFLAVSLLLFILPAPAQALDYRFALEKEYVDVHIKKDGSIDIDYEFQFINYGQLDGVDIGLPNRHYDQNSARATIILSGTSFGPSGMRKSPYVPVGVAVEFGDNIRSRIENQAGAPFTLKFHINNPHMVYQNELKDGTVGIRFRPTWFSASYQQGPTGELRQRIFFPPGFTNSSQAVWLQGNPWDSIQLDNSSGLLVAAWDRQNVSQSSQEGGSLDVGAGFPTKYVDTYYKHDLWEALDDFFASLGDFLCTVWPCLVFALVFTVIIVAGFLKARRRARDYFEPELGVPGAGPRRDLTAVEAAIVLERPLEMVATMILFGLQKKGMVQADYSQDPIRLRPTGKPGEH